MKLLTNSIDKAKEIFDAFDKELIEPYIEKELSTSIDFAFELFKSKGLTGEELMLSTIKAASLETVRQSTFIASLIKTIDPNEPINPRDFIRRVK